MPRLLEIQLVRPTRSLTKLQPPTPAQLKALKNLYAYKTLRREALNGRTLHVLLKRGWVSHKLTFTRRLDDGAEILYFLSDLGLETLTKYTSEVKCKA